MSDYSKFWFTAAFAVWLFFAWFSLCSTPKNYLSDINEYDIRDSGSWE